jgi:hypothetical protein
MACQGRSASRQIRRKLRMTKGKVEKIKTGYYA